MKVSQEAPSSSFHIEPCFQKKEMHVPYLAPLTLVLAASATAAGPPAAAPPVDVVLTRFLDMGGVRAGGGGERLMREATSSRMSLK